MSSPNGLNPSFAGIVKALTFKDDVGSARTVFVKTNGATHVTVFGTTNLVNGTIVGVKVTAIGGTAANIILATNNGGVLATIAKGATAGAVTGSGIAFSAFTYDGTCEVYSSVAGTDAAGGGNAIVEVSFIAKVPEIA
jgi:hypothetical protein